MKRTRRNRLIWILAALGVLILLVGGLFAYTAYRSSKIPAMTFQDCLRYSLRDNEGAVVSVGILQGGRVNSTVYGKNAEIISDDKQSFEIGSLTKTITAVLVQQAIDEGLLRSNDTIGSILSLPNHLNTPTLEQLLTHHSGYKGYYFAPPMTKNFFLGRNSFYDVSRESVLAQLQSIQLADKEHPFAYSNFGYAVLGLALEQAYQTDYTSLVNDYLLNDFGLYQTHISSGNDELPNGWDWSTNDAYLSAGALVSTMDDMLIYAGHLLNQSPAVLREVCEPIGRIDATSNRYTSYGLRMDSIGSAWILDDQNGIVWHNGGTGHYSCYLGFDLQRQIAVVVLTNLSPNERIPATVIGAKLLLELQANLGG